MHKTYWKKLIAHILILANLIGLSVNPAVFYGVIPELEKWFSVNAEEIYEAAETDGSDENEVNEISDIDVTVESEETVDPGIEPGSEDVIVVQAELTPVPTPEPTYEAEEAAEEVGLIEDTEDGIVECEEIAPEPSPNEDVTISQTLSDSEGNSYYISAVFGSETGIPEDALLVVEEITSGENYYEYINQSSEILSLDELGFVRVFDISIVKGGVELEPADGTTVTVTISLLEVYMSDISVIHFDEDNGAQIVETMSLNPDITGTEIIFDAEGFSAYAIVTGPTQGESGWLKVKTIEELKEIGANGVYLGHPDGYYYMNTIISDSSRTGIKKTTPAQPTKPADDAAKYYFELVEGEQDQFYVYCYDAAGLKQYIFNGGNNSLSFVNDFNQATKFTANVDDTGRFTFNNGTWYWNMQGGAGGSRFCSYHNARDENNKIYIWYYKSIYNDPYGLDGKSYGLMNYNTGVYGNALMAEQTTPVSLSSMSLAVLTNGNDRNDKMYVSNENDINLWSFEWIEEDLYYLSTTVGGVKKYISISSDGIIITDIPSDSCKLQVIPGTGDSDSGKISLAAGDVFLTYNSTNKQFRVGSSSSSDRFLNLVEISDLTVEYFLTYAADKVSVSDEKVTDGTYVIIYTRIWNESKKSYEYYAVDYNGSLVRVYEEGNQIQWIGNGLNTMLWHLTEYYGSDNLPNGYYELYNEYAEKYIAPQITDGQIMSDNAIGINLIGRNDGEYYSKIIAWDDYNYSYAAIVPGDGRIETSTFENAHDFYFAILTDASSEYQEFEEVSTVDNSQYGITMRLVDFDGSINRYDGSTTTDLQHYCLGNSHNEQGGVKDLLSTNLIDGYPVCNITNRSLSGLFEYGQPVNHLFIESTYLASGYFEFDSCQNFATILGEDGNIDPEGNFRVYQELGTMNEGRPTLKHGQFMPFNDIQSGVYSSINYNTHSALGTELTNDNPRKYEQLYLVQNPNYYFGIELETSFVQTPNGQDDWGHDIIYEFTGDDDFWLYVDGELVIDLGGIHSALSGSINYAEGTVTVNGTTKYIDAVFKSNYISRGMSEAQADARIADLFEPQTHRFKDYTTHEMKVFYMERGAGASNLHMRFNQSSVTPGTVLLKKEVDGDGVDENMTILAQFPYQIYYQLPERDGEELLSNFNDSDISVNYRGTQRAVPYSPTYDVNGYTYNNVFFLRPGEECEIHVPDDAISYRIVECGIDPEIYSKVSANSTELAGVAPTDPPAQYDRKDYSTTPDTVRNRPSVTYTNTINPGAIRTLSITKILYDETGIHEAQHELHDDPTTFNFRLYLDVGAENADTISAAYLHNYQVKDPEGNYCYWDTSAQKFEAISGATDFAALTLEQKSACTFNTSMNGAISKIPAFYTVEVRGLLVGTQYKVEERINEIPDGYTLQCYNNDLEVQDPVSGVISKDQNEHHVDVCNLKGWGIRVNKDWTDADYMTMHGDIYFAVFTKEGENYTPVPDTVRRLQTGQTSAYWFFEKLDRPFAEYVVREVNIVNPVIIGSGEIRYDSITPIDNGGELTIDAQMKGKTESEQFTYTVTYDQADPGESSNIRTDTITNYRPGLNIIKQDWEGYSLSGAIFILKDDQGNRIGRFISDDQGRVTIAYLREGVDYTLTETRTPQGYHGLEGDLILRLDNGVYTVNGANVTSDYYNLIQNADDQTLYVKNISYNFTVVKRDRSTGIALQGVHFALHRQRSVGGVTTIDYNPIEGYEDLVTDANGVVPQINSTLAPGIYQLRETQMAQSGEYKNMPYINFRITETGDIFLVNVHPDVFVTEIQTPHNLIYNMSIGNLPADADLIISKEISGNMANQTINFPVQITLESNTPGGSINYSVNWTINGVAQPTLVPNDEGKIVVDTNFGNGDVIIFSGLRDDTKFTVTENTSSYPDYSSSGYLDGYINSSNGTVTGVFPANTHVHFVNSRDVQIPLGVKADAAAVVCLLVPMLIISVMYCTYKIGRREDD